MTTFILSLFLPYTIEFDTTSSIPSTSDNLSPADPPPLTRLQLTANELSLLNAAPTVPNPSGYHSILDPFFSSSRPVTPAPPVTALNTSAARTYPAETHAPEWGKGRIYNQPLVISNPVPPSTILRYAKEQEAHTARQLQNHQRYRRPPVSDARTLSRERERSVASPRALNHERHLSISTPRPMSRERHRSITTPRNISRERRASEPGWTVRNAIQGDGGLVKAVVNSAKESLHDNRYWIGTLGFPTDSLNESEKHGIEDKLENEYDAMTVFVKDRDFEGHYTNYCKAMLWPVMGYQLNDHPRSKAYEDHSWKYYVKVNEAFAERVVREYKHGDTIWVEDYHLLLVPAMIRKKLPDARIGFFLHAAFPSSELFRCLAVRKQLLEGMLGANLIGFQTEEYAVHFLTTCGRLLVVEVTEHGVQLEDHFVNVTSVPMGIVPDQLMVSRREPEVTEWIKDLTAKYKDKYLLVARDRLDSLSGVRQKLLAYELFLKRNPDMRENVVLLQVATPRGGVDKVLNSAIADIVTRIDANYSTLSHQPLVFLKRDIDYFQYLALLTVADALIVTPLRDGMNLTGHDFVVCQDGTCPWTTKKYGPLILSESAGSATVFDGAELTVNPWDYLQCARAIRKALEMSDEEKAERYSRMLPAVYEKTGINWVLQLDKQLSTVYDQHQMRDTMSIPRLSIRDLCEQYKRSTSRLFILDYEGTLATWKPGKGPSLVDPQRVVDVIIALMAASDSNIVYIASGSTPSDLEHYFRAIPGVGLIAENGCYVRPFTPKFEPSSWIELADASNPSRWKRGVMNILKYYEERVERSTIEERNHGIVFRYHGVTKEDHESAARQAGEAANHINDSCQGLGIRAVPVDNSVVVEPVHHSKMTASTFILDFERRRMASQLMSPQNPRYEAKDESLANLKDLRLEESTLSQPASGSVDPVAEHAEKRRLLTPPPDSAIDVTKAEYFGSNPVETHMVPEAPSPAANMPDFLMVAGDNREDEPVFRWAEGLARAVTIKNVISVCVGKKHSTEAGFTLNQGVAGLLTALGKLASL